MIVSSFSLILSLLLFIMSITTEVILCYNHKHKHNHKHFHYYHYYHSFHSYHSYHYYQYLSSLLLYNYHHYYLVLSLLLFLFLTSIIIIVIITMIIIHYHYCYSHYLIVLFHYYQYCIIERPWLLSTGHGKVWIGGPSWVRLQGLQNPKRAEIFKSHVLNGCVHVKQGAPCKGCGVSKTVVRVSQRKLRVRKDMRISKTCARA